MQEAGLAFKPTRTRKKRRKTRQRSGSGSEASPQNRRRGQKLKPDRTQTKTKAGPKAGARTGGGKTEAGREATSAAKKTKSSGGAKAKLPDFVPLSLATLYDQPPDGAELAA